MESARVVHDMHNRQMCDHFGTLLGIQIQGDRLPCITDISTTPPPLAVILMQVFFAVVGANRWPCIRSVI